jgi:hypothetical protein
VLVEAVKKGIITKETALAYSTKVDELQKALAMIP